MIFVKFNWYGKFKGNACTGKVLEFFWLKIAYIKIISMKVPEQLNSIICKYVTNGKQVNKKM